MRKQILFFLLITQTLLFSANDDDKYLVVPRNKAETMLYNGVCYTAAYFIKPHPCIMSVSNMCLNRCSHEVEEEEDEPQFLPRNRKQCASVVLAGTLPFMPCLQFTPQNYDVSCCINTTLSWGCIPYIVDKEL